MTRFLAALLVILTVLSVAGCGSKTRRLSPEATFSYNIVEVPSDWPDEKVDWPKDDADLALRQQQAYEKYGAPDYFRVRWRKDGRIVSDGELTQMLWSAKSKNAKGLMKRESPDLDWMYLDKNMLISFPKSGVKKEDLPDVLRVVSEYGDPNEIKESRDVNGMDTLILHYYDEGRVVYFKDGKKTNEEIIQAMPGMIMRR
jgi:hypothetical protein